MADPSDYPALQGGWKKITGYLGPVADEAGYYLAETDDKLGLFQHTGSGGVLTMSHRPLGQVDKTRGKRDVLIKNLLGLVKGAPLTE
ncbi:MAG: hypothetical protein EXR60_05995 [Dehalococcoidia bacterium]|nr:hypothetical protein [Dehalococcoidia bacterium]